MLSSLLPKISADGICMETIDQVVVKPFVKGATDAVEVRGGLRYSVETPIPKDEDNADSARDVSS